MKVSIEGREENCSNKRCNLVLKPQSPTASDCTHLPDAFAILSTKSQPKENLMTRRRVGRPFPKRTVKVGPLPHDPVLPLSKSGATREGIHFFRPTGPPRWKRRRAIIVPVIDALLPLVNRTMIKAF